MDEEQRTELHPLSQAILTGYQWAQQHDIEHNHCQLFNWQDKDVDLDAGERPVLTSACAVGFGWIGELLLSGVEEQEVLTTIYCIQRHGSPEYNTFVRDTQHGDDRWYCPYDHCDDSYDGTTSMTVHLNDSHSWPIEKIVEWIQEQEPEQERVEIPVVWKTHDFSDPTPVLTTYELLAIDLDLS